MSSFKNRVQLLRKVPFFSSLDNRLLGELCKLSVEMDYVEGDTIVKEGEIIDHVFIVISGFAEVRQQRQEKAQTKIFQQRHSCQIKDIGPGDTIGLAADGFFSKTGLRTATVTALSEIHLLSLSISALNDFLKVYGLHNEEMAKTSELMLKMELIKRTTLFTDLSSADIHILAQEIESVTVPADTFIFRQKESGDKCYLICSGELEVTVQDETSQEIRVVGVLESPMVFGETSLLTQSPRNASVKTKTTCKLLVIYKEQLENILKKHVEVAHYASHLVILHSRPIHLPHVTAYPRETSDGEKIFILKNHDLGSYYRLSKVGWYIWQLLDGKHTLQEIADAIFDEFLLFSPDIVTQLVTQLVLGGFVQVPLRAETIANLENQILPWWKKGIRQFSRVMEVQCSIKHTDNFVAKVYKKIGYIFFNVPMQLLFLGCMFFGMYAFVLLIHPALTNFKTASLWLLAGYIPLTLISVTMHEFAHALTTKAFGFEVLRFGFGWYWLGPIAFADTSDMWLGTRRQRIIVNAAGMYVDAIFAGLACIVGLLCVSTFPHLTTMLWIFALFNYLSVFKNLDPTLAFDGYYILMDILDKSNLRSEAIDWLVEIFPNIWHKKEALGKYKKEVIYFFLCILFLVVSLFLTLFLQQTVMIQFYPHVVHTSSHQYVRWFLPFLVVIFAGIGIWIEVNTKKRARIRMNKLRE